MSEHYILDGHGKPTYVPVWDKPIVLWCQPNLPSYYECDGVRWQVGTYKGTTYRSRMRSL